MKLEIETPVEFLGAVVGNQIARGKPIARALGIEQSGRSAEGLQ